MATERERIARLSKIYGVVNERIAKDGGPIAAIGIGDDAAVIARGSADAVLSVDAAIEDVHFRRSWIGAGAEWQNIGYRATAAALSDLAAMGARPSGILSSLALPGDIDEAVIDAIAAGIGRAADAADAPVIGGNLTRAMQVGIHTTVIGEVDRNLALRRVGARIGDRIFVTDVIGAAALGLTALEQGRAADPIFAEVVSAFLFPVPKIARGMIFAKEGVHAAIDVSDGLIADVEQIAAASAVRIRIDLEKVPRIAEHHALAELLGIDGSQAILAGGEDYQLLCASDREWGNWAIPIGEVIEGVAGVVVIDGRGSEIRIDRRGFDHFG